jgi:hypothetical protein
MSDSSGLLLTILAFGGFCVFFLLIIGVVIYVIVRSGKAINEGWGEVARRTGLAFKPAKTFTSPELSGSIDGRPVRVYTYSVGSGRNRTTYTAVDVTVNNPANSSFEVTPSGTLGNWLGRMVKAQDVQIGNAEFDERYVIKSDPPDFALKVLGSIAAQTGIMALPGMARIALEGPTLRHAKRGVEEDPELLMQVITTLTSLTRGIEG